MANRSLGTLTLNVIAEVGGFEQAMGRAERAAEKMKDKTEAAAATQKVFDQYHESAKKLVQSSEYVDFWVKALDRKAEAEKQAQSVALFEREHQAATKLVQDAEYVSFWNKALESKEAAEKSSAANALFEKEHQAARKLVKDAEYVRFWNAELEKKDAAEKKAASQNEFIESLRRQSEAIGKTRADLLELRAQEMGVSQSAAPYIAKLREQESALERGGAAMNKYGMSAKATAAALRGVPAQFTDIFVSLQGGQAPLTVLLQQGGQLKDMFGGIGPAARALGGYIVGLINPFTVTAVAIGAFAAVSLLADRRLQELTETAVKFGATGRNIDITGISKLVSNLKELPGVSRSIAIGVVDAFSVVRQISPEILEPLSLRVADFAAATGASVPDAAKKLADAFKDPVAGAKQLDDQLGLLTAEQRLSIESFVEQGNRLDAQKILMEALTEKTRGLADQGQTPLTKATDELGKAFDRMLTSAGNGAPWQTLNNWLAETIKKVTRFIDWAGSARLPPWLEQMFMGGLNGMVFGNSSSKSQTPNTGGATGSWGPNTGGASGSWGPPAIVPSDAEDQIKHLIEATKGYKSQAGEVNKVRENIDKLKSTLSTLKSEGKENTQVFKQLSDSLVGAQERLDSMLKRGQKTPKAYQDDAATRMLQQLREQEAVLREQLAGTDKLGAAQRELIKFEQQITDLKEKRQLTADQKSLLAAQESIKAQLQKNVSIEAEVKAREAATKEAERLKNLEAQFDERARQRGETIRNNSDSRNEQYQRSLGAFGLSERQRQEVEAQRTVFREFQRMQLDLVKNTPEHLLGSDKYVTEMTKIKEAQDQALEDLQSYFDSVRQLQGDWTNGATRALSTYVDDVANVSAQVERLFTNTFSGLEEALVNFVKTGKLSFSDLADSIIADITRIIVRQQITGPLAQLVQGNVTSGGFIADLFGGLFGGARANGGLVQAGKFYEVNERGSELFTQGGKTYLMSSGDGRVDPIRGGAGGAMSQTNNFILPNRIDRQTQNQIAQENRRQLERSRRLSA